MAIRPTTLELLASAPGRALIALSVLAVVAGPASHARAHEILHTVERGSAIAVRAQYPDGEQLADCVYEVFAPADRARAHQRGRTDRNGWLAFVPDAPGAWRVKIVDATGHGVELHVEAAPGAAAGTAVPTAAGFALRPVAGAVAIGGVFAALFALYRRRSPSR